MDNFEKMLHEMFDDIWDCEIDHQLFQDTVGDLMKAVIEAHKKAQLDFDDGYADGYSQAINDWGDYNINNMSDYISRKMAVEAWNKMVCSEYAESMYTRKEYVE